MAKATIDVTNAIMQYARALEKVIRLDKIILFGSYSRRASGEWSDIDLAVISPDFDGLDMFARLDLIAPARASRDSRIEALGYGSRQFEHADRLTFLGEIKRTGKVIYPPRRRQNERVKPPPPRAKRRAARRSPHGSTVAAAE